MPAKASRAAFGEALLDLGARDERIVTVDADLSKSTMTAKFAKAYPSRAFNVGIAESGMIGLAAGLALAGRVPFACSFACFLVGRFETIRVSVAYTRAPVKLVGTHVGVAIGEDGYSQMGLEDIACLRALPNIPIVQPADEIVRLFEPFQLVRKWQPGQTPALCAFVALPSALPFRFPIGPTHRIPRVAALRAAGCPRDPAAARPGISSAADRRRRRTPLECPVRSRSAPPRDRRR